MTLSLAEKRALGEEGWRYKMTHGRWPKAPVRPAAKRMTAREAPTERAPLPRHKRGEKKLTVAVVRARLQAMKMERGCMDCGYRAHPAALEFDHARDTKSITLSQCSERYWSVVEHEVAKCDVVCANCHRIRTANRTARNKRTLK